MMKGLKMHTCYEIKKGCKFLILLTCQTETTNIYPHNPTSPHLTHLRLQN